MQHIGSMCTTEGDLKIMTDDVLKNLSATGYEQLWYKHQVRLFCIFFKKNDKKSLDRYLDHWCVDVREPAHQIYTAMVQILEKRYAAVYKLVYV